MVLCFDEAYNWVKNRGQMDVWVKFWNEKTQLVTNFQKTQTQKATSDHEGVGGGGSGAPNCQKCSPNQTNRFYIHCINIFLL